MLEQLEFLFKPFQPIQTVKKKVTKNDQYEVIRMRRKTFSLQVKSDLSVCVKVPLRASKHEIKVFVDKHASWIQKRKARISKMFYPKNLSLVPGETIPIFSKKYILKFEAAKKSALNLDNGTIIFKVASSVKPENQKKLFDKLSLELAHHHFIPFYEEGIKNFPWQMFEKKPSFKVRALKSQWGNYSKSKNLITLNSYLLHYPKICLLSVIYHELCHVRYYGHGKRFYGLLNQVMPDWKKADSILKGLGES